MPGQVFAATVSCTLDALIDRLLVALLMTKNDSARPFSLCTLEATSMRCEAQGEAHSAYRQVISFAVSDQ
jgi:hypothetical protein